MPEPISSEELMQLWFFVLEGFRQCFGLDKALDPEAMKNVHLYPELQKRFASLSVFDRTLASNLAFQVLPHSPSKGQEAALTAIHHW